MFEHLPNQTCARIACIRSLPGLRAHLFVKGKHIIPYGPAGEENLRLLGVGVAAESPGAAVLSGEFSRLTMRESSGPTSRRSIMGQDCVANTIWK